MLYYLCESQLIPKTNDGEFAHAIIEILLGLVILISSKINAIARTYYDAPAIERYASTRFHYRPVYHRHARRMSYHWRRCDDFASASNFTIRLEY